MGTHSSGQVAIEDLPDHIQLAVEMLLRGGSTVLTRDGAPVARLTATSTTLEGTVLPTGEAPETGPSRDIPEGTKVVATAMKLSDKARAKLSAEFGSDYVVLDFLDAPPTTDVLLINPVSPQLLGRLRHMFPDARVLITEIEDEELEVSYAGPVGRLLGAGAEAYLPPRAITEVAQGVHAYLNQHQPPALGPGAASDAEQRTLEG